MESVKSVVKEYIDSRIEMTLCMQRNFRQLCTKCRHYTTKNTGETCPTYTRWVDAWMKLQRIPYDD